MIELTNLLKFVTETIGLLLIPGPAIIYIITRTLDQGKTAGVVSVLGLGIGALIQVGGLAIGVSVLIKTSAIFYHLLKYCGAGYLVFLGFQRILKQIKFEKHHIIEDQKISTIFIQGIIVDVLNVKTALFIIAFFPQFIDMSNSFYFEQLFLLGTIFVFLGLIFGLIYVFLALILGDFIKKDNKITQYFAGGVYITIGIFAAIAM